VHRSVSLLSDQYVFAPKVPTPRAREDPHMFRPCGGSARRKPASEVPSLTMAQGLRQI
jgi:hypothetical protein